MAATPGRLPEAIAEYQATLRIQPQNAETHYNLANALIRMPGRLPEAMAEYQAALRIDPDHDYRHGNTPSLPAGKDRGGHAQFRDHCSVHASFEPHHGEAPASWHVVRKPTPAGRQAGEEPGQPGPLNATT